MRRKTSSKARIKIDDILQHGMVAAGMIRDFTDNTSVSYLKPIAGVALMIMETAQVRILSPFLTVPRILELQARRLNQTKKNVRA